MRRFRKAVFFALLFGSLPCMAHARDAGSSCGEGDLLARPQDLAVARVVGSGRLHFLGNADGCPAAGSACEQRAYVLPGDRLVAGPLHGSYRCACFPGKGGGTAGWVARDRLRDLPVENVPALPAWIGHWRDGDDTLVLSLRGDRLAVRGDACWPSANPPLQQWPGGPNVGSISAQARPDGRQARFVEGDDSSSCRLRAVLLGNVLAVTDNGQCGGLNVSFDGFYQRP